MKSLIVCLLLLASLPLCGQNAATNQSKTKLEAFQAKTGTVVVRGFQPIGSIRGELGGSVQVEAVELNDAVSGSKVFGVKIEVGKDEMTDNSSWVDADEIDSLLKGLDYIAKIDGSVTKMKSFQADYKTRDDLTISTFSQSRGGIGVAVTSGRIGQSRVFLSIDSLAKLRALVVDAKGQIDAAK